MHKQAKVNIAPINVIYYIGLVPCVLMILQYLFSDYPSSEVRIQFAYSFLFVIWGGLIYASAYLAVKKGRELVEGAILGAFGPIGFIIEVLLPPIKGEESTTPTKPRAPSPQAVPPAPAPHNTGSSQHFVCTNCRTACQFTKPNNAWMLWMGWIMIGLGLFGQPLIFLWPPGLILVIVAYRQRKPTCAVCRSRNLIPTISPGGQELTKKTPKHRPCALKSMNPDDDLGGYDCEGEFDGKNDEFDPDEADDGLHDAVQERTASQSQ